MNYLQLKYAVGTADALSVSKAAEDLGITQPNLSRQITQLESELGFALFERNSRGMGITPRGFEFIERARDIVERFESVKGDYLGREESVPRFSVCLPPVKYLIEAFIALTENLPPESAEFCMRETDTREAVRSIERRECGIAVIRVPSGKESYIVEELSRRGMAYEEISKFRCAVLMNKDNPLDLLPEICDADLAQFTELSAYDGFVPEAGKMYVPGLQSRLDILARNTRVFTFSEPVQERTLVEYGLVQQACKDVKAAFLDLIVCEQKHRISGLDRLFIDEVHKSCKEYLVNCYNKSKWDQSDFS